MTTITADHVRGLARSDYADAVLAVIDGEPVVVSAVDVDPADVLYTRPDLVNEFGPEITDIEAEVLASGLTARIPD